MSSVQVPAGTVNRIVTLNVTATDNIGVTAVRFFVDGVLLGNDVSAPYAIDWATSGATEGAHMLPAGAQHAAVPSALLAGWAARLTDMTGCRGVARVVSGRKKNEGPVHAHV